MNLSEDENIRNFTYIKTYKDLLEDPDFEQNHYSRTAEGIY